MLQLVVIGILLWTLFEYAIHKLMFHSEDQRYFPKHAKFYAIHFLVHGIHHAFPQDRYRLVFPPILGYPIMNLVIVPPIFATFPQEWAYPVCVGALIGYIGYDMIHYFLHHANPKTGYWKNLKVYHMQHHYKNGTLGFGVSSKFWDVVFRTEIIDEKAPKQKGE